MNALTLNLVAALGWLIGASLALAADDVAVEYNLAYRDGVSRHCALDLAMPKGRSQRPRPAILVIHGGGWVEGDKSSFSTAEHPVPGNILDFARLGFVAATMNYRLSGEAPWPAALDDCRCAVRYLRAHAQKYGIDLERIGAYGNSAGGHLALLLGAASAAAPPAAGEPYAEHSSLVQAVISDSGPLDLARGHEQNQLRTVIEKFLGGPPQGALANEYRRASPASYASAKLPPLLLIYGVADEQVDVRTADEFVAALGRGGHQDISYLRLAGVGHCPHSLVRIEYLKPAVNDFFGRTLARPGTAK